MEPTTLMCPADMVQFLRDQGHTFDGPHAWILFGPLDGQNKAGQPGIMVNECVEIDIDDVSGPGAFREIIESHRDHVAIFIHTHNTAKENGEGYDVVVPCEHDVQMTIHLAGICILHKVHLMDHCIIGIDSDVYSLAQNAILHLCLAAAIASMPPFLRQSLGSTVDLLTFASGSEGSEMLKRHLAKKQPEVNRLPSVMLDAINEARARQGKPPLQM